MNSRLWLNTCVLLTAAGLVGCVSRTKAQMEARAAFAAGQREALRQAQQMRGQGQMITLYGNIRNPLLPYTPDLTLGKALIAAEYLGARDPYQIIIVRAGRATAMDTKQLLTGEDVPLAPGDIIQIQEHPIPGNPR